MVTRLHTGGQATEWLILVSINFQGYCCGAIAYLLTLAFFIPAVYRYISKRGN
jgi:hypothetical protein